MIICFMEGILIDEKTVGIWYLPTTPKQDFLCVAREIARDEEYEIVYRFRYYKDDKAFESADEKNWYRAKAKGTKAYLLDSFRSVVQTLVAISDYEQPFEIINDGDLVKFRNEILNEPFAFARLKKVQQ